VGISPSSPMWYEGGAGCWTSGSGWEALAAAGGMASVAEAGGISASWTAACVVGGENAVSPVSSGPYSMSGHGGEAGGGATATGAVAAGAGPDGGVGLGVSGSAKSDRALGDAEAVARSGEATDGAWAASVLSAWEASAAP
jgi:hypothetical protein